METIAGLTMREVVRMIEATAVSEVEVAAGEMVEAMGLW